MQVETHEVRVLLHYGEVFRAFGLTFVSPPNIPMQASPDGDLRESVKKRIEGDHEFQYRRPL